MGPIDAFLHLVNFLLPALCTAAVAGVCAKWLWRRELASVAWSRLWVWGTVAGILALVAGLMAFGRDGKMATYGGLILATAVAQWWAAFRR